jgi:hypothetical protein
MYRFSLLFIFLSGTICSALLAFASNRRLAAQRLLHADWRELALIWLSGWAYYITQQCHATGSAIFSCACSKESLLTATPLKLNP